MIRFVPRRAAWLGGALATLLLLAGSLIADIPVPDPPHTWARNAEPSNQSVMISGGCLALAAIVTGLLVARWPARGSTSGLALTGVITLAAVAGIAWATQYRIGLAEQDRAAWRQWEKAESDRRARWRGPDEYRPEATPIEAPPPSDTLPPATEPPTSTETTAAEPP